MTPFRIPSYLSFARLGLLLCLLLSACSQQAALEQPTPTTIPTPVVPSRPTYRVERGDVVSTLDFSARIVPVQSQELFFKTAGRVARVLVKQGDSVKKDQLLAELDTGSGTSDLRRAQINLDMAQLNQKLVELKSPHTLKEYPTLIGIEKDKVALAQLALDDIQKKIALAQIVAPFDGTIASAYLAPDAVVEAYKGVIVLSDLSQLEASADLMSTDLKQLSENMPVELRPGDSPGQSFAGLIRRLPYPYGQASQSSNSAADPDNTVRLTLPGDWQKTGLKIGSLVKVQAILEKHPAVLWLPPQAIRKFEGRLFVITQDDQGQHRVDVQTGLASSDRVEILQGLSENQLVVAP